MSLPHHQKKKGQQLTKQICVSFEIKEDKEEKRLKKMFQIIITITIKT